MSRRIRPQPPGAKSRGTANLNYEHAHTSWRAERRSALGLDAEALRDLADHCECAPAEGQAHVLRLLSPWCERAAEGDWSGRQARIEMMLEAGAHESAVIQLFPAGTVYTGGSLADGSCIGQVLVTPGQGAHSRKAATLANAWLAALLRSLARVIEER